MSFPRYPKYKPSGVEWLGDVPEGWVKTLGQGLANEIYDQNIGLRESNLLSLSYGRIIRKDSSSNDGLLPESFETYQIVNKGQIIFRPTDLQNDMTSLRSAIVQEKGIITSAYIAIESTGSNPFFLNYLFRAYDLMKVFYSLGGGLRQAFKFSDIKKLPFFIPSKSEQLAIASFLDHETAKIDALIAEQQRLIELLKEKRQAVISHAVTKGLDPTVRMKDSGVEWLGQVPEHWEVRAFGTISNVVRGGSPRPAGDPLLFDGDFIPWVTVAEITKDNQKYLTETETFLTELGAERSRLFKQNTLIYSNSGATLGVPKILKIQACANDGVIGFLNLNNQANISYLYFFLLSITETIREKVKQGSGQPNLNTDIVKSIKCSFPPIKEQIQIVEHIEKMCAMFDSLETISLGAINLLQERRTALISAAVTGQIDVRGFQPAAA